MLFKENAKDMDYESIYKDFKFDIPDHLNISEEIEKNSGVALIDKNKRMTYREIKERSGYVAKLLREIGISKGDVVSILLDQSFDFVISLLGIYKMGGTALALSPVFGDEAIKYRICSSGSRAIISNIQFREKFKSIDIIKIGDGLDFGINGKNSNEPYENTKKSDPAQLIYTSGTTGNPKGAMLPHQWVIGNMPAWIMGYDFPDAGSLFSTPAEWAWAGGLADSLLPALYTGNTVVIRERKKFDPDEFFDFLNLFHINYLFLVPSAIRMIKSSGKIYNHNVKSILTGGEYISPELINYMHDRLGIRVNQTYGQTEANMVLINMYKWNNLDKTGRPVPGHRVNIYHSDGTLCNEGETGEIGVELPDPVVMIGYNNADAKIIKNVIMTGDLGYSDHGFIKYVNRSDEIIKISGYRINPIEVENVIDEIPFVKKSAVAGIDDDIRGKIIGAIIVLKDKTVQNPDKIIKEYVRDRLALYAYPRLIKFSDFLPETYTGKVARALVKRELIEYKSSINEINYGK